MIYYFQVRMLIQNQNAMNLFKTFYNGRFTGQFFAETKFQAINSVFETLRASGLNPDRIEITAQEVKKVKGKTFKPASQTAKPRPVQLRLSLTK